MREESVRLLEQGDRRERLVGARVEESLVPGDAAELDEERRVEVQAVDEGAGAGIFEEHLLGRRQRRAPVGHPQRRALEGHVHAPERAPSGEEGRQVQARLEHRFVPGALMEQAERVSRGSVVDLAVGTRARDPGLAGAVDEAPRSGRRRARRSPRAGPRSRSSRRSASTRTGTCTAGPRRLGRERGPRRAAGPVCARHRPPVARGWSTR